MNDYIQIAKDFISNTGCNIDIKFNGLGLNRDWGDKTLRNTYSVTIVTPRGEMTIKYWDSVYNTKHDIKPSEYDILSCLQKNDCGTFEAFCYAFGYDTDSMRAFRIYQRCVEEYNDLCRIFTEEQMEKLRKID